MQLLSLPLDIVLMILKQLVRSACSWSLSEAARLRLVCKMFATRVLHIMFEVCPIEKLLLQGVPCKTFGVHCGDYMVERLAMPASIRLQLPWLPQFLNFMVSTEKAAALGADHFFIKVVGLIAKELVSRDCNSQNSPKSNLSDSKSEGESESDGDEYEYCRHRVRESLCALAGAKGKPDIIYVEVIASGATPSEELVQDQVRLAALDEAQSSLLAAAAYLGRAVLVEQLIQEGADANRGTTYFGTPLMAAAHAGHAQIVRLLIAAGSCIGTRVDTVHAYAETALEAASRRTSLATVEAIIEGAADGDGGVTLDPRDVRFAIRAAAESGSVDVIVALLKLPVFNINRQAILQDMLLPAVTHGREDLVRRLINLGVNVNSRDKIYRGTALRAAARHGYSKIVSLLISAGASQQPVRQQPSDDPMVFAAKRGHVQTLEELATGGLLANEEGLSQSLDQALIENQVEAVNWLLAHGAGLGHFREFTLQTLREKRYRTLLRLMLLRAFEPLPNFERQEEESRQGTDSSRVCIRPSSRREYKHRTLMMVNRHDELFRSSELQLKMDTQNRSSKIIEYSTESMDAIYKAFLSDTTKLQSAVAAE